MLAGGRPDQIEAARRQAAAAGIGPATIFAGQRPAEEIPAYLDAADVLVSPRSLGTNTPLKIYQYLRSGRPIVATRLLTHTQVLDDDVAFLTEATPEGFACRDPRGDRAIPSARAPSARARCISPRRSTATRPTWRARAQACAHLFGDGAPPQMAGRRRSELTTRRHYSYEVYADPAMAERFDAMRFSGPIGRLIADTQEQQIAGVPRADRGAARSSTSARAPAARRSRSRGAARS